MKNELPGLLQMVAFLVLSIGAIVTVGCFAGWIAS